MTTSSKIVSALSNVIGSPNLGTPVIPIPSTVSTSEAMLPAGMPQRLATMGEAVTKISTMLQGLDEAATATSNATSAAENHLAQVRLGVAAGLFSSLRFKHAASAAHSLRVAIECSAWAAAMKLSDSERDRIEVAALLHDVGKIGVPDGVLLKPGKLNREEVVICLLYTSDAADE